jgi:hypothetical protein
MKNVQGQNVFMDTSFQETNGITFVADFHNGERLVEGELQAFSQDVCANGDHGQQRGLSSLNPQETTLL